MSRRGGYQILNFGIWGHNFKASAHSQDPEPENLFLCKGISQIIETCIKKTEKRIIISGLVVDGVAYRDFEVQRRIINNSDITYDMTGAGMIIKCFTEGGKSEWGADFEKVFIMKAETSTTSPNFAELLKDMGIMYESAGSGKSGGN